MIDICIPQQVKESLDNYAAKGWRSGGFLEAVLSNDLFHAFGRADHINKEHMESIVSYIYNNMPSGCHGPREIVENWISMKRKEENEDNNENQTADS